MTSTTRRRSMTEQAAEAAIDQACRSLRLPTIRNNFDGYADAAGRGQLSYRGFLAELLMAECEDRIQRRTSRRIREAGFPRAQAAGGLRLRGQPQRQPGHHPHPCLRRLGPCR